MQFTFLGLRLSVRPVYHHKRDRIIAHFMICYTSLLIHRLLQTKLYRYGKHFSTENIIRTLQNMEVANIEDMWFQTTF